VLVGGDRAAALAADAAAWPALQLTAAQLADLELLLLGAFGPAPGYPEQTLREGLRVPSLIVAASDAVGLNPGDSVALRQHDGELVAVLRVGGVRLRGGPADAAKERAAARARTASRVEPDHQPEPAGEARLVGTVAGLRVPAHGDFPALRLDPVELRAALTSRGWLRSGEPAPWAVWADGLLHTADIARIRALTRQGKRCVVLAPVGGADPVDERHQLRVRALLAALDALDEPLRPTEATLANAAIAAEATGIPGEQSGSCWSTPLAGASTRQGDHQPARAMLVLVPVVPSPELAVPRADPWRSESLAGTAPADEALDAAAAEPADRAAERNALRAHLAEFYGLGGSLTGPALGVPEPTRLAALLAAGTPIPAELTPAGVATLLAHAGSLAAVRTVGGR
jgi:sulfate adenylyltransferase